MASVWCADLQFRTTEFLDVTSLTRDEFQHLVRPFEAAFQAHMRRGASTRNRGPPAGLRSTRTTPWRRRKIAWSSSLVYLKTYALQVVHGRLFGMGQSKANQWMHILLPVLLAALRALGDTLARSLTPLAQRLGVSETDAASVVTPLMKASVPVGIITRLGKYGWSLPINLDESLVTYKGKVFIDAVTHVSMQGDAVVVGALVLDDDDAW